jgi:hypothetical protein
VGLRGGGLTGALADDGSVESHVYEIAAEDQLILTSMADGSKYDLTRQR